MKNNGQETKSKEDEFRAARKIVTLTVEYMSLIIIICSFMISLSMMTSLEDFQNAFGKPYPETAKYETQVEEKIGQLHEFLEGCNKFETDGIYDPDRIVDIENYALHKNITGQSEGGLSYRLHDLLQWAQQGAELDNEEKYSPIGYKDIEEYARKTGKDRDKLYLYVKSTIAGIWDDVWHYNTLKVEFNGKNTNLKYIVLDKNNKQVYGNTGLSEEQILDLGTYVVLDYKKLEYDANLKFKKNIYSNLGRGISPNCIDSRIVIGVDTSFLVQDEFYDMKERYENWMPWSRAAAVVCGVFIDKRNGIRTGWSSGISELSASRDFSRYCRSAIFPCRICKWNVYCVVWQHGAPGKGRCIFKIQHHLQPVAGVISYDI